MSQLARLAPGDATVGLILQVVVQLTAVVFVALAIDRMLARRHAAARHGVWLSALLMVLGSPAIVLILSRTAVPLATIKWRPPRVSGQERANEAPAARANDQVALALVRENVGVATNPRVSRPAASPMIPSANKLPDVPRRLIAEVNSGRSVAAGPDTESRRGQPHRPPLVGPAQRAAPPEAAGSVAQALAGALVFAWLIGMAVLLARLIRGVAVLAILRRTARPVDVTSERSIALLEQVRARLNTARLPVIASSPRLAGPAALGVLRPVVILPEGWFEAVPDLSLRDLLIHECAHLVRRDPLIGVFQRLAELIYWPHPLVHFANHCLARAREEACDDVVLSRGDAVAYAGTLLDLAERYQAASRPTGALALLNPRWNLEHRVAGILDPRRNSLTRAGRWKLAAAAVTIVMTSVAVAGVRWDEPRPPDNGRAPTGERAQVPGKRDTTRWSIPGLVVDEAGNPVGGARVRLAHDPETADEVTSSPDGAFVIRANDPIQAKTRLIAKDESGRLQGTAWSRTATDSQVLPIPARIVLEPSQVVTVSVSDPTGKPIAGAAVEVVAGGCSVATGITDAAGRATIRYLWGMNVECVIALKAGAGLDYFENYRSSPSRGGPTLPEAVSLVLNGADTVRVKAIDPQGEPVPGLILRLSFLEKQNKLANVSLGSSNVGWVQTDRQGMATFDWLPRDRKSNIPLTLAPGAYSAPGSPHLARDGVSALTTVRVVRNAQLRGKVVKPDGLPGAGIIVEAAGASSQSSSAVFNAHGSTRTTADGTYQMSVPPDHSYMVGVFDQNWAAKTQTGLTARAGEPCDVPDLGLIKGTEIRGRVTLGPARKPLAGQTILLTESGPPVAVDNTGKARGQTNSIGRQLDADGKGRFSFRVGPGDYELTVIRDRDPHADFDRFPQKVGSETLIEREFQPEDRKDAGESRITGVVSDRKNGVLTPVAGARVEPVPYISSAGALIDSQGRFDLKWRPETWHHNSDKPLLYARSSDGALSAFTPISSDQREIAIELLEAGRATGEVVDENGKPLVGRGIHLDMSRSGSPLPFTGHPEDAVTDAHGRYTFSGLVVGAHCRVSSYEGEARRLDGAVFTRGFRVESAVPTTLPSLIFPDRPLPQASIGAKENEDGRLPVKFAPLARPATVPAGLSRAEIEALIQAIGRDPISPRLVDRIMERFHPRLWPNDFDDIRPVALDPAFVQRMDGLARDVLGKSLDTIMLLRCAIAYQPGFDDAIMKSLLKQWLANDRTPRSTVRGAVIDHETFLPIRNARVATDLHDFTDFGFVRTDEQGRFRLSVTPGSTWNVGYMELLNDLKHVPVYVEADGYASALRFVPVDEIEKAEDFEIALLPEAPLFGTVVDRSGRPIAGASVQAEATWATFITGGPKPRDFLDVLGGHFSVLTDREGRFSFAGVPAPDQQRSITLWVRHPEFRSTASSYVGAPTDPGAAPVVTLEPGCTVSGVVVNRAGNSVPEASVRVFDRETSFFQEQFARTDRDGRFRFRNMPPGWAMMLVESPRLAAAWAEIVATPARAIDNQFVLEPGRSVGGKVVDEAGKPVAGATVGCNVRFPAVNGIPSELSLNVSTLTADDGSFRTGSLPPGDLQLVATLESRGLTGETVLGSDRADVVIKLANGER